MSRDFSVGRAIKSLRKQKGLSQGEIARRNNWERSYMSDLERGKILNPSFETILMLVNALGVACDDFVRAAYGLDRRLDEHEICPICLNPRKKTSD